jgi:hypothetical protein
MGYKTKLIKMEKLSGIKRERPRYRIADPPRIMTTQFAQFRGPFAVFKLKRSDIKILVYLLHEHKLVSIERR